MHSMMSVLRRPFAAALSVLLCMGLLSGCGTAGGSDAGKTAPCTVSPAQMVPSATNPGFSALAFDFSVDPADGDPVQACAEGAYHVCITGFRQENASSSGQDSPDAAAANVAAHFAGGSPAELSGIAGWRPVDCEKFSDKSASSSDFSAPYGDANLCWAASAADMLHYTGWGGPAADEDTILSLFTDAYPDEGSYQYEGIKFYMNGVNLGQAVAEAPDPEGCRNAVFNEEEESDLLGSTQIRYPGSAADGKLNNLGTQTVWPAENLLTRLSGRRFAPDEIGACIIDAIDRGASVGLGIVFVDASKNARVGVHALTVFGYVTDESGELCGLVIADSDNDLQQGKAYPSTSEESFASRKAAPDTYGVYPVGTYTMSDIPYLTLEGYRYYNPKMKYSHCTIQSVTILEPMTGSLEPETQGTCDAANTPDIILKNAADYDIETRIAAETGKETPVSFILGNASYKGISAVGKPVVNCLFRIFTEEGSMVEEVPFPVPLVTDTYTTGEAGCAFSVSGTCTFKEPGNYRVDVEVLNVTDAAGNPIPEAYTSNNCLKTAATVTAE